MQQQQQGSSSGELADVGGVFDRVEVEEANDTSIVFESVHHDFATYARCTQNSSEFVGDLKSMARDYSRLYDWSDGWMTFYTDGWDGERGKEFSKKKAQTCLLPQGEALSYFWNPLKLANRLEAAGEALAKRYNDQKGKKVAQTWRDVIARKVWANQRGKEEETVFEVILSSYNFHQQAVVAKMDARFREEQRTDREDIDRQAVMKASDVKIQIKMRTTVKSGYGGGKGPNKRTNVTDGFKMDRHGLNVSLAHFLHGLRLPRFQDFVEEASDRLRQYRLKMMNEAKARNFLANCQLQSILSAPDFTLKELSEPEGKRLKKEGDVDPDAITDDEDAGRDEVDQSQQLYGDV